MNRCSASSRTGICCLQTQLPESFHRAIYERFDTLIGDDAKLNPGNNLLPAVPELNRIFADPVVRGALTSVVGPDYVMHPHRALHNNPPGSDAQRMHKDSYWGYLRRVRNHRCRWAMIMYVPQATPLRARADRGGSGQPVSASAPGRDVDAGGRGVPGDRRLPADPLRHLASQDEELHRTTSGS